MERENRFLVIAITVISVTAILFVALVWPGLDTTPSVSGSAFYDEAVVERVYAKAIPSVVEVYSDLEDGESFVEIASGSGFLIDNDGHIITNNHVVRDGQRVRISLYDNTNLDATVIGRSLASDIALLKVDADQVSHITPAEMGDAATVRPGQMVIVIGSPFGLKNSVSVGINSGVNRGIPNRLGRFIPGMLQTDALISPGNSGGPMLNRDGQVIGVTTAIELSSGSVNQRIGFAVPINTVQEMLPQLKSQEVVTPPWLGTYSRSIRPLMVERLGLPVEHGFYVIQVLPDSPAQEAGLIGSGVDEQGRPVAGGDIIIAVDGVPVQVGAEMTAELNRSRPGDVVTLTVIREGERVMLPVTLGTWPGQ